MITFDGHALEPFVLTNALLMFVNYNYVHLSSDTPYTLYAIVCPVCIFDIDAAADFMEWWLLYFDCYCLNAIKSHHNNNTHRTGALCAYNTRIQLVYSQAHMTFMQTHMEFYMYLLRAARLPPSPSVNLNSSHRRTVAPNALKVDNKIHINIKM